MILRDYQVEMLSRLERAWESHRSVMVQMPTGTGKTVLMGEAIRRAGGMTIGASPLGGAFEAEPLGSVGGTIGALPLGSGGVLVVAHRRELIEQIRGTIAALGIPASLVRVESIQKLAREIGSGEPGNWEPSLVIVDEAHHALAKTYRMLWERWPEAKFLGLTATPCRLSGEAFTDLFEVLLQAEPIQWFIDKGWLSDFEYVSAAPDNPLLEKVRGLRKRGADGDYQTKEMVSVMDVPESIGHLFETYREFAWGKKGIVYAIDIEHARHIAAFYSGKGVRCAVIDSKTPARERERLVEAYRGDSTIDVLVNVDIFSEGFDCPEVEFIQLARPTLSLNKYLQQVGRGMRVSKGKPHVLILDNVGLYQTFGLPTVERDWRQLFLGRTPGKGQTDLRRCVVLDDEKAEKQLVKLDMVRIKRGGQKGTGLEVFLQDGRYGVMRNGRVTCPAKFSRIERLQKDCGYFALGINKQRSQYNHGRIVEVTTVIDKKGEDMNVRLFGHVSWLGGYFGGVMEGVNYYSVLYWDPLGNSYYDTEPGFYKVGGVEIANASEHHSKDAYCKKLRYSTGKVSPRFNEWEMFYNRDIVIARDYLVVKKDHNHSYRICGYLNGSVLVQNEEGYGYQQIFTDGKKGALFHNLPQQASRVMNQRQLGLVRAEVSL